MTYEAFEQAIQNTYLYQENKIDYEYERVRSHQGEKTTGIMVWQPSDELQFHHYEIMLMAEAMKMYPVIRYRSGRVELHVYKY